MPVSRSPDMIINILTRATAIFFSLPVKNQAFIGEVGTISIVRIPQVIVIGPKTKYMILRVDLLESPIIKGL